jgi:glycopeptide antibiotics resistance protein
MFLEAFFFSLSLGLYLGSEVSPVSPETARIVGYVANLAIFLGFGVFLVSQDPTRIARNVKVNVVAGFFTGLSFGVSCGQLFLWEIHI